MLTRDHVQLKQEFDRRVPPANTKFGGFIRLTLSLTECWKDSSLAFRLIGSELKIHRIGTPSRYLCLAYTSLSTLGSGPGVTIYIVDPCPKITRGPAQVYLNAPDGAPRWILPGSKVALPTIVGWSMPPDELELAEYLAKLIDTCGLAYLDAQASNAPQCFTCPNQLWCITQQI